MIGNINPKTITIIPSKNSLFIIKFFEMLNTENSEVKIQNSSIRAIGRVTPNTKKTNSMKLKNTNNYYAIFLNLKKYFNYFFYFSINLFLLSIL